MEEDTVTIQKANETSEFYKDEAQINKVRPVIVRYVHLTHVSNINS